jgi:phosphoglycolate phosphatase
MNKAILFDFDGVIVDTFSFCYEISKKNAPDLTEQGFRDRFKGNIFESLKNIEPSDVPSEKLDFWTAYTPELNKQSIDPEMNSTIQELHNNYDLFIVSSTVSSAIINFLEFNKILSFFKEILGSDIHKSKEHKINSILQKYNFDPKDCLYITDTVGDILEARQCRVRSVAVTWGYHDTVTLALANPDTMVSSPKELLVAINDLMK